MPESPHQRRSIRLPGYDYTQPGAYFVTLVTQNRLHLFGEIVDGEMRLNNLGQLACAQWLRLTRRFAAVELDEFVIMPNHLHGIIFLHDRTGTGSGNHMDESTNLAPRAPTTERFGVPIAGSIPTIIRSYKSSVTQRFQKICNTPGAILWQRNYYEHIICNDDDLRRIRDYICNNPLRWVLDRENAPFQ
jgi:REP element-mobilizing transposase RayT